MELSTQTFVTKQNTMRRAEPIPEPIDPYLSDNDDSRSKITRKKFDRDPVANWSRVMTFLKSHTLEPNRVLHPSHRSEPSALGIDRADFAVAVVGNGCFHESQLCNRMLGHLDDHPEAVSVDGLKGDNPIALADAKCPRFKVISTPSLKLWETFRTSLVRADVIVLAFSDRLPEYVLSLRSWCARHGNLLILVRSATRQSVKVLMKLHHLTQDEAFRKLEEHTHSMLRQHDLQMPVFHIDCQNWEHVLKDHDAVKDDSSSLLYEEGKLLRFIARAAFSRVPSKGSPSEVLRALVR